MTSSKELRAQVKQDLADARLARKERKKELSALTRKEKRIEIKKDKKEAKRQKKQRKLDIREMPRTQRLLEKKRDRIYKNRKKMPKRITCWTIVVLLIAFLAYQLIPLVQGFAGAGDMQLTSNTQEAIAAREAGALIAKEISDEGLVLLMNKDDFLPLKNLKINVFGTSSFNFKHGGAGSGAGDTSAAVSFYQGLVNEGIEYNKDLYNLTKDLVKWSGTGGFADVFLTRLKMAGTTDEPDPAYLTDKVMQDARAYSDTALIIFSGQNVEASDSSLDQLKLSENKAKLLEKVAANFSNVIIVINTGNTMELSFLEQYPNIKSAIWVGTPGPYGADSLAEALSGRITPSGRLVDTFAYDVSSSPASVNFGNFKYTNIKGRGLINYEEGIYVGYRFYETYYSSRPEEYKKAVQFPFGFGLSYTDFKWTVKNVFMGEEEISLSVEVTNIGKHKGKDVVQLYYSAPYIPGGIEKSSIELASFAKTDLLYPGESQTIELILPIRQMASYDMNKHQAYVLDPGVYYIKVARNVHELASTAIPYKIDSEIVFSTDEVTNKVIKNQFAYANGDLTYLSRNDWVGTFPSLDNLNRTASEELLAAYNQKYPVDTGTLPTMGKDNNISLKDMKGLEYNDPKWQDFLDQFTYEEMAQLISDGAYKTIAIPRLGMPGSVLLDGPAGINAIFGESTAASYPSEVVLASTWNTELAYKMGEAVGVEANALGVHGWYAPAMNIHRTAQGGRNFEYFSEDPLLSGKFSAAMTKGAQSKNIIVTMKHFALNEQEVNARSGVLVWANEQAIREIYLKPFEITVKEGEVTGVMTSFILIGHKWSGGNPELLNEVLRKEWGFVGLVTTDAVLGGFMDVNKAIRSGNDLMLAALQTRAYVNSLPKAYKEDPVGVVKGLRQSTHNITYALVNYTNLFD